MKKIVLSAFVSLFLLMMTITHPLRVLTWSNGGYSDDPSNPDYGTHDWIAEHALDWLPEEEKRYIVDNLAAYLYGTELPDNGMALDGIGDTAKHHVYYWSNRSLQDDASAVRASEEYSNALNFLKLRDFENASKTAGIMSHYIVDIAVFSHVMGADTDWGAEEHHSNYETYVNQRTSSYDAEFNVYLSFDGELNLISAYNATKELAYDTTFDVNGDLTCVWMDQNYNWSNPVFKNRCGESLNLAINYVTDVLHTLYSEVGSVHNIDTDLGYLTIQEAIDAPETLGGHTIKVDAGIYYEHVTITKSILLTGESRNITIIDGNGTGPVVTLSANSISVANFTIRNGGHSWSPSDTCIWGRSLSDILIENNTVTDASNGIIFHSLHDSSMSHNFAEECGVMGLHLDSSNNCKMANNTVINSFQGIVVEKSAGNFIQWNNLINNNVSANFYASAGNLVEENNFINSTVGILLDACNGSNDFRGNNMTSNTCNLIVWGSSLEAFMQNIDTSNIANNRTVYYITNSHNLILNPINCPNVGYLALVNCTGVAIKDIDLSDDKDGMLMAQSTNNSLINVTLANVRTNITLSGFSSQPLIHGGLTLFRSDNNLMTNSRITNNSVGVCLCQSNGNLFCHNSFVEIDRPVISNFQSPGLPPSGLYSINEWNNGLEGNYWSNYTGTDSDLNGVGDTPYVIDENNQDNYPLMGWFSDFNVTSEYQVTTISNSTVSDFQFNGTAMCFNVTGDDGTVGFCRVCIPTALMNDTFKVFVNGTEVPYTLLQCSNSTHSYLYFTYNHSTQEVIIIPEFPTWTLMLLPFIVLTIVIAIYKRRLFCCS